MMPAETPGISAGRMGYPGPHFTIGKKIWRDGCFPIKRLKELEDENRRLKRMYADLSLDHELLKDVIEKKF
jgi:putative transposase